MANQIISMNKIKKVLQLLVENIKKRKIARLLEMSRTTIERYISIFDSTGKTYSELLQFSTKDLYALVSPKPVKKANHDALYLLFPDLEKRLAKVGVTKLHLWENYRIQHADGVQYTQFCYHFNLYLKNQKVSYIFEHKAGDKLMVDYAGKKLYLTDIKTGELTAVEVFIGILPCSGYTFVKASYSQQSAEFLGCLGDCLVFMGGVPQAIVTDNLKPAINKASKYDPEINKSMADFAEHYNTCVLPTRARSPKDKALVEGAVNIIYTRVYAHLHDCIFQSLNELNAAIFELVEKHNLMLFQGKDFSRKGVFESTEKQTLRALPDQVFELRKHQNAKVQANCHVLLSEDKHYYSVPFQNVGKMIEIIYSKDVVEIYQNHDRIAVHQRFKAAFRYTTNEAHLHPRHQYYKNWSEEFFTKEGGKIGENTSIFIQNVFAQSKHPEQGFKLCQGVLQLAKKYGNEKLELACEIGIMYDYVSYNRLKYIIELKNIDLKKKSESIAEIKHENIRGASYYQ